MDLRETILASNDLPTKSVEVSEWGVTAYVRTLAGAERIRLETDIGIDVKAGKAALSMVRVVCLCLSDESGKPLFQYPKEMDLLQTKSISGLKKVFDVAMSHNLMGNEDIEELKKS